LQIFGEIVFVAPVWSVGCKAKSAIRTPLLGAYERRASYLQITDEGARTFLTLKTMGAGFE
jgi:hypothetical protein